MSYSLETIYKLVGRDDKVAVLSFKEGTESHKNYGEDLTVVFLYTPSERQKLEKNFAAGNDENTHGKIKAKSLRLELPKEKVQQLKDDGILSSDIESILDSPWPSQNVYHSEETREIHKIEIPLERKPKGGDYNWMYGFSKQLIRDGIGSCQADRERHLAMKKFFEEDKLTPDEINEMIVNVALKPTIEEKFLEIKFETETITPEEQGKLQSLWRRSIDANLAILKQELDSAGTSLKKISSESPVLARFLLRGTYQFNPHRLNVSGRKAICLDFKGFLHVFLRHVKEFGDVTQYKTKDKFLWKPQDITMVMQKVITSVDKEIQDFWEKNPDRRFEKYGEHGYYFEGDYYSFYIEADGKLSTFFRNRKTIVKESTT